MTSKGRSAKRQEASSLFSWNTHFCCPQVPVEKFDYPKADLLEIPCGDTERRREEGREE